MIMIQINFVCCLDDMVAAMSLCDGKVNGMVMGANQSLEILPLNNRLKRMLDLWQDVSRISRS